MSLLGPLPEGVRVLSALGAWPYGNAGGTAPLTLSWTPLSPTNPTFGLLVVVGGLPGAPGVVATSLVPGNATIGGLPLLVDIHPSNLLPLGYFGFDSSGQLVVPLDLRNPFVGGTPFWLQAFQTGIALGASQGLELLFIR